MTEQYVGISDFINLRASILKLEKIRKDAQLLVEEFQKKRELEKRQRAQILAGLKYLQSVHVQLDALLPELEKKAGAKKERKQRITAIKEPKHTPIPKQKPQREIKTVNPTDFVDRIKSLRGEFEKIKKEI